MDKFIFIGSIYNNRIFTFLAFDADDIGKRAKINDKDRIFMGFLGTLQLEQLNFTCCHLNGKREKGKKERINRQYENKTHRVKESLWSLFRFPFRQFEMFLCFWFFAQAHSGACNPIISISWVWRWSFLRSVLSVRFCDFPDVWKSLTSVFFIACKCLL